MHYDTSPRIRFKRLLLEGEHSLENAFLIPGERSVDRLGRLYVVTMY